MRNLGKEFCCKPKNLLLLLMLLLMKQMKELGTLSFLILAKFLKRFKLNWTKLVCHYVNPPRSGFHSHLLKLGSTFPQKIPFRKSSLPGLFTNFLVWVVILSTLVKPPFISTPGRINTFTRKLGQVLSTSTCMMAVSAKCRKTLRLLLALLIVPILVTH